MNPTIENIIFKTPRVIWHLGFWLIYISFFALVYGSFEDDYGRYFLIQLTDAYVQIPAVYLTIYWLMPAYLFKEKLGTFFIWFVVIILSFSFLSWLNYIYFQDPFFWSDEYNGPFFNLGKILKFTTKIYPVMVLALVIKWFKYWYLQQKINETLIKEKLNSELNFLKSQVHPHFLFNTLNNLYALTLKKSSEAPEVVLKLSGLLDYMLYECNVDQVPLEKEVDLVQNYIALEKLRYGDRLKITFQTGGISKDQMIAPLLILPFVENAFKHGVSEETDQSWIKIDLQIVLNTLMLNIENSKSQNGEAFDRFSYKEGIGLKNVRRRLELIYPDRHVLQTNDSGDSFSVTLKLDLIS